MTTLKELIIPPDQDGYSVEKSAESVIRIQLDGGAGRYRQDLFGVSDLVSCQWILDGNQYNYLQSFYRFHSSGSMPFMANLIVEHAELKPYECRFMPNSFKLTGVKGLAYFCSATLECTPIEDINTDLDADIVYLADMLGPNYAARFAQVDFQLQKIVNINIPSYFK